MGAVFWYGGNDNQMKSYHWMKLHNEALHDPKMQQLSDRLYRRTFECFMMASEMNAGGELPPIDSMAWLLRVDVDILETELMNLSETGIVSKVDGVWHVTNFAKRQARASDAERMQQHRSRKHKLEYYGNSNNDSYEPVTTCNTDKSRVDKNRIDKSREEEAAFSPVFASSIAAFSHFRDVTGMMAYPGSERDKAEPAMDILYAAHGDQLTEYLKPYYQEWIDRKYKKTNLAWLYDWAISGEIPEAKTKYAKAYADATEDDMI